MWNPKYPICIQLAGEANLPGDGGKRSPESWGDELRAEPTSPKQNSPKHGDDSPTVLYLFGRTGREKEEWFRHFLLASMDSEREKQRDTQKPGKYVCRSGTWNINGNYSI